MNVCSKPALLAVCIRFSFLPASSRVKSEIPAKNMMGSFVSGFCILTCVFESAIFLLMSTGSVAI